MKPTTINHTISLPAWSLSTRFFWVSVFVTLLLRLWVSTLGHNFDFESFQLVADLASAGKNVYAETYRYNYSPLWMWLLAGFKWIGGTHFRTVVAAFVSVTDVAIAVLLFLRGNRKAALLVLYAPMCIIISGYHNQFDNLAVLLGLIAIRFAETRPGYNAGKKDWGLQFKEVAVFAILLGFSLLAKHLLIFFMVWLALHKNSSFKSKLLLLLVPYGVFLLSFAPYWATGSAGIKEHVFLYKPIMNGPIYYLLLGQPVVQLCMGFTHSVFQKAFYGLMLAFGFFMRKKPLMEQFQYYLLLLVIFASTLSPQYMVIPMVALGLFANRFWIWYNLFGLTHFIFHRDLLHVAIPKGGSIEDFLNFLDVDGHYVMCFILLLAFIDIKWPHLLRWQPIANKLKTYL